MSAAGTDAPFPWRAVLLLGGAQLAAWGSLYYAITLLAGRIMAQTGWNSAVVHGGFSLALVAAALAGPRVGRLLDQHGGGRIMAAASILAGFGLIVIGLARSEIVYIAGWLIAGLAIAGTLYDPAFVTLAQLAPKRARAAITTLTLIGGFASTVSWPVTYALLARFDWREICFIYGAAQILVAAPLYWFALGGQTQAAVAAPALAKSAAAGQGATTGSAFFWLLSLAFATNTYVATALTIHLVPALAATPVGEQQAVIVGMAFGPAQVVARLVELTMLRGLAPFSLGLVSFALMPIAMMAMVVAGFSWTVAFFATAVAGAGNGLMTIARGVLPLSLFGHAAYGATLGLFVAPIRIATAAAPVTFAILLSVLGAQASFGLLLLLSVLSFVAMLCLKR